MLNQIVVVGRLVDNPKVETLEDGKKVSNITLAVPRSYKNVDGVYETDFVDCTLWNSTAENTSEYCRKGDIVGVKGRVQVENYQDKEGNKKKNMRIVAEKLSFLSSKSKEDEKAETKTQQKKYTKAKSKERD